APGSAAAGISIAAGNGSRPVTWNCPPGCGTTTCGWPEACRGSVGVGFAGDQPPGPQAAQQAHHGQPGQHQPDLLGGRAHQPHHQQRQGGSHRGLVEGTQQPLQEEGFHRVLSMTRGNHRALRPAAHTPDKRQIAIISEGARPRYVRPFTLSAARSGCLRFRDSLVPDAPSSLPGQASAWFTSLRVRCANFALKCPPFPAENPAKSGTASGLRGTLMSLIRSLRGQVLTLLGGSLLLMLLIALASFQALNDSARSYQRLLEGPATVSLRVASVNLDFKTQVQEWKNLLLRSASNEEVVEYWQRFERLEQDVQRQLGELQGMAQLPAEVRSQLQRLQQEHQRIGQAYRQGRHSFLMSGFDASAGDEVVRGIDRDFSEQLEALTVAWRTRTQEQVPVLERSTGNTVLFGLLFMLVSSLVLFVLAQLLLRHQLIDPINGLIGHIDALSQGHLGKPVDARRQDELGRLALASNRLRDFLAETFRKLQASSQELDRANRELETVSSRMAGDNRKQVERTEQVATAMHEMSATAQEVARHTTEAAQAADAADGACDRGEQAMRQMVNSINSIRGDITHIARVVHSLADDSARIGAVL